MSEISRIIELKGGRGLVSHTAQPLTPDPCKESEAVASASLMRSQSDLSKSHNVHVHPAIPK